MSSINSKKGRAAAPKLKQPPANERPVKHRPTAAEKEERVSQVMTLLLGGMRRIEIVQFGTKTWGIVPRQTDDYIAEATALIKANAAKTRDEEIVEHVGRMDLIYRAAHGSGDYQSAIRAAQDKAKMRGLYPPTRQEITGPGGGPIQTAGTTTVLDMTKLSDGELDQLTRNLEAAVRPGATGEVPPVISGSGPAGVDDPKQANADAGPVV